ncbi:MAG: hypothetical protein EOM20_17525 [Spartobacteria bacterium]|nr:hypothetical protein [Spartobacteria bacterium]
MNDLMKAARIAGPEILSAVIEEGRERKRRLRKRLADWIEARRGYGRVPAHTDLFLRRARANHAKAVKKARWLHAVILPSMENSTTKRLHCLEKSEL